MPPRRKKAAVAPPAKRAKQTVPSPVAPPARGTKTCSGCQAKLPRSATECRDCGKTFGNGPKETNPKQRPIPPPPPSDEQLAEALKKEMRFDFGIEDHTTYQLKGNDRPNTCFRAMRGLCTKTMMNSCAAFMIAFGFAYPMVETSLCCAWWWWSWVGILVCYWKKYGWGIWSFAACEGGGKSGGGRPVMRALGFMGDWEDWIAGRTLSGTALRCLALFLDCSLDALPSGLCMIPCYGPMLSVIFMALNRYFPLLYITVVCTKRGEHVCESMGLGEEATHTVLSGCMFLSHTIINNSAYFLCPSAWLGHENDDQRYLITFVLPAARLYKKRVVCWSIRHSEPTLRDSEASRRLVDKLKCVARLLNIPLASSKTNHVLWIKAVADCFKVNADVVANSA